MGQVGRQSKFKSYNSRYAWVLFALLWLFAGTALAQDDKKEGLLGGLNSPGWSQPDEPSAEPATAEPNTDASAPNRATSGRPDNMPVFRNTSDHPGIKFEGNYEVRAEGIGTMYVGIRKGANYSGDTGIDKKFYHWGRDLTADWESVSEPMPGSQASFGQSVLMKNFQKKGAFLIWDKADYYDGLLTEFYQIRAKPLDSEFNQLVGNWRVSPASSREVKNGRMRWRRLKPKIKSTKIVLQPVALSPRFATIPQNEIENSAHYGAAVPSLNLTRLKDYFGETTARMRGNRPSIHVYIYGDDMWDKTRRNSVGTSITSGWPVWLDPNSDIEVTASGSQPIYETLEDGRSRVMGARVALNLWQDMKPGIHTLYFDGQPIPFELTMTGLPPADPAPELRTLNAISLGGDIIEDVYEGNSFQIQAVYAEEHPQSVLQVNIPPPNGREGDGINVVLNRQTDKAIFKSEVLRLEHAAWNENELLTETSEPDARAQETRSWLKEYLDGNWVISHLTGADDTTEGRAQVLADESRLYVQLGEGRTAKFYESEGLRTDIGDNDGEPFPRLVATLENRPYMERYFQQNGDVENYGAGRPLMLKYSRVSMTLKLDEKDAIVGTFWNDENLEQARLQLYAKPGAKAFEGFWETRRGDSRTGKAQQIWTRNGLLRIATTQLLDDQFTQRPQADDVYEHNYIYPYMADGTRTIGENKRTIVLLGRNLPSESNLSITSEDEAISYEAVTLPEPMKQAFRQAALSLMTQDQRAETAGRNEEVLVLKATLKEKIEPGTKTFFVNESRQGWSLGFRDQIGIINFTPSGEGLRDPPDRVFYQGQSLQVAVKSREPNFPIGGSEIKLQAMFVPEEGSRSAPVRRTLGTVTVASPDDAGYGGNDNVAVSPSLVITIDGLFEPPAVGPDETLITLKPGERLLASTADPMRFIAVPQVSIAKIEGLPRESGIWQDALKKVAQCPGVKGDPASPNFDRVTSASIERFIFMEWLSTRRAQVTNGDHAALLLLREAIVREVAVENRKLERILNASNPSLEALRFRNNAAKNPAMASHPFWKFRIGDNTQLREDEPARHYGPGEADFKLAETLNMERFMEDYGHNRVGASDIIAREVLKNIKKQHDDSALAITRAEKAGNCNLDELLVIAGQKSTRAVASLWPDLVMKKDGRWMPDNKARTAVRTVYGLGAEVRALERLSDIDDAYASMAVALASGGLAAGGTALGALSGSWAAYAGTTAASMALALDGVDLAYFGMKGIEDYLEGEENYVTALGLSPTLGSDVVAEAAANRKNPIMAAVGVIAPGVGVGASASRLRNVKAIENGRRLLRDGMNSLDELSQADRLSLAAYYKYLEDAKAGKTSGLFNSEASDLRAIRKLIRQAGGVPPTDAAIRAAQNAAQNADAVPVRLSESEVSRQLDSFGDDIDDLIKLPGQTPRPRSPFEKTEVDPLGKQGAGSLSKTDIDTVNPRQGRRLTQLDKEPPLRLPDDVQRDLTAAEPGHASKHLTARDVAKLMQLKRPLTPDEALMREDLLRQYVNNPESLNPGKLRVLQHTTEDLNPVLRLSPIDDSAPLLTTRQLDDLLEATPGSLSEHLSDAQVRNLFRPGATDLSTEDLILKMDIMRSSRAPDTGPSDPVVIRALEEMFSRRLKSSASSPASSSASSPSLEPNLIDSLPGSVVHDFNATRIEPITELPGNAPLGPMGTQVLLKNPTPGSLRVPTPDEMNAMGPFTRAWMETLTGKPLDLDFRMMPAGRSAQTASSTSPMVLDNTVSQTYLYTVLPNGDVRYVAQIFTSPTDEVFKHSMLTGGGVAGQSGEIRWVNGAWQINSSSGRYGQYYLRAPSEGGPLLSRSPESLDAANRVLQRYGVKSATSGTDITLQPQYRQSQ